MPTSKAIIITCIIIGLAAAGIGIFWYFRQKVSLPGDTVEPGAWSTAATGNSSAFDLPHFMVEENFIVAPTAADILVAAYQDLGVKMARAPGGPFVWDNVERARGTYDFAVTDLSVSLAADAGVALFATLWPYAQWDQDLTRCRVGAAATVTWSQVIDYRCPPQDYGAYQKFLDELVERYDGDDDFGQTAISTELQKKIKAQPVQHWEIANEVDIQQSNMPAFFVGSIQDYIKLLRVSYGVIKKACPSCQVAIAAPAQGTKAFYDEIFTAGAEKFFDIYNVHNHLEEVFPFVSRTAKPIWISEGGGGERAQKGQKIAGANAPKTAPRDEQTIVRQAIESALLDLVDGVQSEGLSMVSALFKQGGTSPAGAADVKWDQLLLNAQGKKAAMFYALQTTVQQLEGFTRAEVMPVSGVDCVIKFTFSDRLPVYAYAIGETPPTQPITPPASKFSVSELFQRAVPSSRGRFTPLADTIYFVQEE